MDGNFPMLWQICVAGATCNELHLFVVLDYAQTSPDPVRKSIEKFKMLKKFTLFACFSRCSKNRKRSRKICSQTIRFVVIDMWFMILAGPFKKVASRLNERLFIGACLFANVILVGTFQVCIYSISPVVQFRILICFCNSNFSVCTLEFLEKCAYNGHSFQWHSYIATARWSWFADWYVVWFAEKGFRLNGKCVWRTESEQSGNSFAATKIYSHQFNQAGTWSSCIWSEYLLHWTTNRRQSDT